MASPYDALLEPPPTSEYDTLLETEPASEFDALLTDPRVSPQASVQPELANQPTPTALPGPGNDPGPAGERASFRTILGEILSFPGKALLSTTNAIGQSFQPSYIMGEEPHYQVTEEDIHRPAVPVPIVKAMLRTLPLVSASEMVASAFPKSPLSKTVRGITEGVAENVASLTSASNVAMAPLAIEGRVARLLLAGTFGTQAALNLPDQWKAFEETDDPEEKSKMAVTIIASLGLPAMAALHAGVAKTAPDTAKPAPVEAARPAAAVEPAAPAVATVPIGDRIAAAQKTLKAAQAAGDEAGITAAKEALSSIADELIKPQTAARQAAQVDLTKDPTINPSRDVSPETILDARDAEMAKKAADSLGLRYDGIQEGTAGKPAAINITNPKTGDTYTLSQGATVADLEARIAGKSGKTKSFEIPYAPLGTPDIVDILVENGGIKSRSGANANELARSGELWDDQPDLRGVYRQVLGGNLLPDEMATIAAEHGFGDGTVNSMWRELDKAVQGRRSVRTQMAEQRRSETESVQKGKAFEREVLRPDEGRQEINTSTLQVGDKLSVGKEQFKVVDIDPDSLDVTLEDGKRYGVQQVKDGQALFVDRTESVPRDQDFMPTARVAEGPGGKTIPFPQRKAGELTGEGHEIVTSKLKSGDVVNWNGKQRTVDHVAGAVTETRTAPNGSTYPYTRIAQAGETPEIKLAATHYVVFDDGTYVKVSGEQRVRKYGSATEIREQAGKADVGPETTAKAAEVPDATRVEETPPRLRPGETQGDLLSGQVEDLTLVGEKGPDNLRLAAEKEAAARSAEVARAIQEKEQGSFDNDWTQATIPELKAAATAPEPPAPPPLGIVPPGVAKLASAQSALAGAIKGVVGAVRNIPKFGDFRKAVLRWSATNQKASGELFKVSKDLLKSVPDAKRREGITNWIQAGGDLGELQQRALATTDAKLKRGYEAAMKLTPEEVALAGKIRQTYDILLKRAKAHGIEINEIPDYVNQVWRTQPLREFMASNNRRLSTSIRFAKERYHDSFFHGEQAGLKPQTKDIAKLLPMYMNEVNNAIAAKQFVAEMAAGVASDGRPLLASTGMVKTLDGDAGKTYLVLPEMRTAETLDFRSLDGHPALRDWRWQAADESGNPILVQGDLRIHPEIYDHLKNVLGQSALREWFHSANESPLGAIPKKVAQFLIDDVQQVGKATMLGFLSPFHQVQEGTHAIGHRVNPFSNIPKIDLSKADQLDATQHGLMLLPDRVSAQQFREGLDGSKRNLAANVIGKFGKPGQIIKAWADGYQDYLFHQYIPGLKLKTYEHILPRNMERYADELASGEVTPSQVKYLSAQQSNAAYGHLNYSDIGRNPTMQHIMQMFLLAPDFLEARGRFAAQAMRPSKAGIEQFAALATLAATQFVVSRILNKTLDDDYHWDHPFDVIVGARRYAMRSVPADIAHAFSNTRQFISGRLSPLVGRGLLEGLSGVNYRREPTDAMEALSNIITGMIPLTIQPATRGLSETGRDNPVSPMEQLLGSMGLHVSRFSPVSKIYSLSREWLDENGKNYGIDKRQAVFPISKFQQLRYALEDNNTNAARKEFQRLLRDQKVDAEELSKRFKMSLHHPFTGSKRTDAIFRDSLSPADRQIYSAALERREILWRRYQSVR